MTSSLRVCRPLPRPMASDRRWALIRAAGSELFGLTASVRARHTWRQRSSLAAGRTPRATSESTSQCLFVPHPTVLRSYSPTPARMTTTACTAPQRLVAHHLPSILARPFASSNCFTADKRLSALEHGGSATGTASAAAAPPAPSRTFPTSRGKLIRSQKTERCGMESNLMVF